MRKLIWRFYVYELFAPDGACQYVGKGSGRRLAAQQLKHGLAGRELAWFKRERDAYAFEVQQIAERAPPLNRHPGGNGCRAARTPTAEPKWLKEMKRIGTRAYAARLLLSFPIQFSADDAARLRAVADSRGLNGSPHAQSAPR